MAGSPHSAMFADNSSIEVSIEQQSLFEPLASTKLVPIEKILFYSIEWNPFIWNFSNSLESLLWNQTYFYE